MKKLLALILCVAMVLSLAPAAFAAGTTGGKVIEDPVEYAPKWAGTGASKKAIEDLNKDINAMYTAIAADQAVFGTVSSSMPRSIVSDEQVRRVGWSFR